MNSTKKKTQKKKTPTKKLISIKGKKVTSAKTKKTSKPRGLLLLSGGFDSAIAGHLIQKQGYELEAVHFSSEPITDELPELKARDLQKFLKIKKFHKVNMTHALEDFVNKAEHMYYFVLMKRFMIKTAEKIARKRGLKFLVTGENLAQVSSQTLDNLAVIDQAASMITLRPLLAFDKQEIINYAQDIGTFKLSCAQEHCDTLGPRYPATHATTEELLVEEKKVKMPTLINKAIKGIKL